MLNSRNLTTMEEASKVDGGLPEDLQGILTQSLTTVNADIDDDDKVDELFSLLPDIDLTYQSSSYLV